jgi:hypothetical protein
MYDITETILNHEPDHVISDRRIDEDEAHEEYIFQMQMRRVENAKDIRRTEKD